MRMSSNIVEDGIARQQSLSPTLRAYPEQGTQMQARTYDAQLERLSPRRIRCTAVRSSRRPSERHLRGRDSRAPQ